MKYATEPILYEFLKTVQAPYTGMLAEIQKQANDEEIPIVRHETARFLSTILSIKRPMRVLEIGTAVGFSACLMSKYLPKGAKITTIDRYPMMIAQAKINIKKMNLQDVITIIEENAIDVLPNLTGKYDFIFMDCAKAQYINFLPDCIRLLDLNGILVVDDVLQGGDIANDRLSVPRRHRTTHTRLREFLYQISNTPLVESSIISVGDGIAFCTRVMEGDFVLKEHVDL